MRLKRGIFYLALAVACALMLDGCGAGVFTSWDDWDDGYYYNDNYYSSNCPRHWIIGPLDCRSCHNFY